MTIESELKTFFATALTDAETAITDVEKITSNPLIAPLIPILENDLKILLVNSGISAEFVEKIATDIVELFNKTALSAAKSLSGQEVK